MKIVDIKSFPTWVGHRNQFILKIETDEGIHGWGESGLSGRELAVEGAVRHFREFLIGKDPMQIGRIWQELYRSQYFEGGRVLTAAQSAIDIALHDIKGKALGVPVYQLLGGAQRDYIPCFASSTSAGDEMIEEVQTLIANGWNTIRVFPQGGRNASDANDIFETRDSIGHTAKWLVKLREVIGSLPMLGLDYHHRLNVAEAASFCQRLHAGTLDFLEEPIRDETPEAYEELRRLTPVPFSIGEEFSSKWRVCAVHRARHHQLHSYGCVQCGRVDRSDEGGQLGRGALHRPDAAQPARPHLHRCHYSHGCSRAKLCVTRSVGHS